MSTPHANANVLPYAKDFLLKFVISILLFVLSGIASSYLYYRFSDYGGAFFPGLLYTSTTILIFTMAKKVTEIKKLLIYYLLMNLTYIAAVIVTFISSYLGILVGILTGGFGAIATFMLTDKYIVKIRFSKIIVFVLGGAAFLVTDVLYIVFSLAYEKTPLESGFNADISPDILFAEVFAFWQPLVGIKLFLTVMNRNVIAYESN